MKVKADTEITVRVPCTIEVEDYHEFRDIESVLQRLNKKIRVTEIDFSVAAQAYIGLIHVNTAAHKKLIKELSAKMEAEQSLDE